MTPEPDARKALTKNPLGPTGKAVAENVERLRNDQNLTFAALSERLSKLDRSIPPLGLRKIVAQTRRVDVDDLVALAVALGVWPVTLLMPDVPMPGGNVPPDRGRKQEVEVTGLSEPHNAQFVWDWLRADVSLPGVSDFEAISRGWPEWRQQQAAGLIEKLRESEQASHGDD